MNKTTDLQQVIDKFYHINLYRVHLTTGGVEIGTSLLLMELSEETENNIVCLEVTDKYNIRLFQVQLHTHRELKS